MSSSTQTPLPFEITFGSVECQFDLTKPILVGSPSNGSERLGQRLFAPRGCKEYLDTLERFERTILQDAKRRRNKGGSAYTVDRSIDHPNKTSIRKSRRIGKLYRRLLCEGVYQTSNDAQPRSFMEDFSRYILPQCNPLCELAENDVSMDIPHSEMSFYDLVNVSLFQFRGVLDLYRRVYSEIPQSVGGSLVRRHFVERFAHGVATTIDRASYPCNELLFISSQEQDFFVRCSSTYDPQVAQFSALSLLFNAFLTVAHLIRFDSIVKNTTFTSDTVDDFEDQLRLFLGDAGFSFVVSALPSNFREVITTLFFSGVLMANSLRRGIMNSGFEFDDEIFDGIDNLTNNMLSEYEIHSHEPEVVWQTNPGDVPPGGFPENITDAPPAGLMAKVAATFSKFTKFGSDIADSAANVNDLTSTLAELAGKADEDYSNVRGQLSSFFTDWLAPLRAMTFEDIVAALVTRVAPIICLIIVLYKVRGWIVKLFLFIFQMLMGFAIGYAGTALVGELLSKLTSHMTIVPIQQTKGRYAIEHFPEDDVVFQSGLLDLKEVVDLIRPIMNLRKLDSDDPLDSLYDAFVDTDPFFSSTNKLLFICTKAAEWWDRLKKLTGWFKSDLTKFCSGYEDVDDFAKRCMLMLGQNGVMPTSDNVMEATVLYNLSVKLREKYAKNQTVQSLLRDFIPKIQKLKTDLDRTERSGIGYRVEPVTLFLKSKPGLGKTTAMEIINSALIKHSLRSNEDMLELYDNCPKEFLHTRANSPYWESVTSYCKVVYYADYLSANADKIGAAHEAEIIDLVSCQQFSPNMAFDMKGKLDLRPDYVTGSTNESSIRGDSANHKGAVARRLNVVELVWRGPDKGPVPGMPIDTNHWGFKPLEFNESFAMVECAKRTLSLDEVINLTIIRREMAVRKMSALRSFINRQTLDVKKSNAVQKLKFEEGDDEYDILRKLNKVRFQARDIDEQIQQIRAMNFTQFKLHYLTHHEELWELYFQNGCRLSLPFPVLKKGFELAANNDDYMESVRAACLSGRIEDFNAANPYKIAGANQSYAKSITNLLSMLSRDTLYDITAGVISFIVSYSMIQWLTKPSEDEPKSIPDQSVEQSKTYVDFKTLKVKGKQKYRQARIKLQKVEENVGFQASEAVKVALEKAKYHTWQVYSSGVEFQCIVAIEGKNFFINYHAYQILKKSALEQGITDGVLIAKNVDRPEVPPFKILFSEISSGIKDDASDVVFFTAANAPDHRSILPHWAEDSFMLDKINSQSVRSGVGCYLRSMKGPQFADSAVLINGRTFSDPEGEVRFYRQLWRLTAHSYEGDCGSLYFSTSNDMGQGGKFVGFHALGNNGYGPVYACAVTKTTIRKAIAQLGGVPEAKDPGDRDVIGDAPLRHRFETKVTDVRVPTEHVVYEARQAPAPVNDVDAYNKISAKYNKTQPLSGAMKKKLRTCVTEVLKNWERTQEHAMHAGFMDLSEAIAGIPGTSFDGIDLSTSAGFPHNCLGNTKHSLMGKFDGTDFIVGDKADITIAEVKESLDLLASGVVPMWVYTDITKAELLPKEKVAAGKVRLVSAAQNACVLVTRMLFGNFSRWVKDNCLSNGVEMTNQEGPDADIIAKLHMTMACGLDSHTAGDLSAYDTRHSSDALFIVLDCIVDFILRLNPGIPDEVVRMLKTYVHSLSCTFHIRGSTVHRWLGSLPSGHPLTTLINSLLNQAYFAYSIWKATSFRLDFWPWYFQNFVLRVLGDDNRASCSPEGRPFLSESICADGYADFGHVYTNDEKNGLNDDFRPFERTTLLKRFTRFEPLLGKYIAPLRIDVVEELPLWTRGEGRDLTPSIPQAIQNLETAVKYLSYHPDNEWDRLIPLWERMYSEYGWNCPFPNRESALFASYGAQKVVL